MVESTSGDTSLRLQKVQKQVEKFANHTVKLQKLIDNQAKTKKTEYDFLKQAALTLSIDVGYVIDNDFTNMEKKKSDCMIVFDEFNREVNKLREIITYEDSYSFMKKDYLFQMVDDHSDYISSSALKANKEDSLAILAVAEFQDEDSAQTMTQE